MSYGLDSRFVSTLCFKGDGNRSLLAGADIGGQVVSAFIYTYSFLEIKLLIIYEKNLSTWHQVMYGLSYLSSPEFSQNHTWRQDLNTYGLFGRWSQKAVVKKRSGNMMQQREGREYGHIHDFWTVSNSYWLIPLGALRSLCGMSYLRDEEAGVLTLQLPFVICWELLPVLCTRTCHVPRKPSSRESLEITIEHSWPVPKWWVSRSRQSTRASVTLPTRPACSLAHHLWYAQQPSPIKLECYERAQGLAGPKGRYSTGFLFHLFLLQKLLSLDPHLWPQRWFTENRIRRLDPVHRFLCTVYCHQSEMNGCGVPAVLRNILERYR